MTTAQPTIGSIVHYVLPSNGKHRPAIIVETFSESRSGQVNLLVFKDGINDGSIHQLVEWATAINHNQEYKSIGTWHWPENMEAQSIAMASHEQRIRELEQAVKMIATMIQQRAAIKYEPTEELPRPVVTSMSEAQFEAAAIKYEPVRESASPVTEHRPVRKR